MKLKTFVLVEIKFDGVVVTQLTLLFVYALTQQGYFVHLQSGKMPSGQNVIATLMCTQRVTLIELRQSNQI